MWHKVQRFVSKLTESMTHVFLEITQGGKFVEKIDTSPYYHVAINNKEGGTLETTFCPRIRLVHSILPQKLLRATGMIFWIF